jgi:GMP synthase (glutamine-hydrolysing)
MHAVCEVNHAVRPTRIHWLQHVPFEGLGCIESWIRQRGHRATATRLYRDEPLPSLSDVDLLVVMGGTMSVKEERKFPWLAREKRFIERAVRTAKPVLGVCLGAQLTANVLGADVYRNRYEEIGWLSVRLSSHAAKQSPLVSFPEHLTVFQWHADTFDLPAEARRIAVSDGCENQAFLFDGRVLGLQFHLESTPVDVKRLLDNCGAETSSSSSYVQTRERILAEVRRCEYLNRLMYQAMDYLCSTALPGRANGG